MKTKFSIFISFSLLLLSFQCCAETYYGGVDYTSIVIGVGGEKVKPNAAALRLGASKNNMAFEVQYLTSIETENIYNIAFDLEQSVGFYFVMQSDVIDVSLGYAMTEMAVSGPSHTYNGNDHYNGFSWRIAVYEQIPLIEQAQVRLAYQSLYKDSEVEITGISLGITYQF